MRSKFIFNNSRPGNILNPWIVILLAVSFLYSASIYELANSDWSSIRYEHSPIVLAVAIYLFLTRINLLSKNESIKKEPAPYIGWALILIGLIFHVIGRSQNILFLEIGSLIPVLIGIVALFYGTRMCAELWFPFAFLIFVIPFPASIIDAITQPMKIAVSAVTESILYWAGYPVARDGVVLLIGQYKLLVADACAGLNSLFTLEALGLLYLNLVRYSSLPRNIFIALIIVPVSFSSNTIRVIALALITFYMGDNAGQGFLHFFSGIFLFLIALLLIISLDTLLGPFFDKKKLRTDSIKLDGNISSQNSRSASPKKLAMGMLSLVAGLLKFDSNINLKHAAVLILLVVLAKPATLALTPRNAVNDNISSLSEIIPTHFGQWRVVQSPYLQADLSVSNDNERTLENPYDAVLMRTYVNSKGDYVMLAIAYAREQKQDVKLHLPEICYPAQGFSIIEKNNALFDMGKGNPKVKGKRLIAQNKARLEAISYWARIGNELPTDGLDMRLAIFREGLAGRVADGMLIRVSTIINHKDAAKMAYEEQIQFLTDLTKQVQLTNPGVLLPSEGSSNKA